MMPLVDVAALIAGFGWRGVFDVARCCVVRRLRVRVLRFGLFFRARPGGCLLCLLLLGVGEILDDFGGIGLA